jgi:hypothetical protein
VALDSGCNGIIFIQMQKDEGDPSPVEIVQHMMNFCLFNQKAYVKVISLYPFSEVMVLGFFLVLCQNVLRVLKYFYRHL